MCSQCERLRILRVELLDDLGPEQSSSAHLGDFHEEVFTYRPEEGETRSKGVDIESGVDSGAEVFKSVREGVTDFEVGGGTGFLHVVTGNGDGVELRHLLRGILEDIADDLHRWCGRIDVGVPHHELLEDIVLDGPRELIEGAALFKPGLDVECEHGKNRAVHGHGNGYL